MTNPKTLFLSGLFAWCSSLPLTVYALEGIPPTKTVVGVLGWSLMLFGGILLAACMHHAKPVD